MASRLLDIGTVWYVGKESLLGTSNIPLPFPLVQYGPATMPARGWRGTTARETIRFGEFLAFLVVLLRLGGRAADQGFVRAGAPASANPWRGEEWVKKGNGFLGWNLL